MTKDIFTGILDTIEKTNIAIILDHQQQRFTEIHKLLDEIIVNVPNKMARIEKTIDDLDGLSKHINQTFELLSKKVKETI